MRYTSSQQLTPAKRGHLHTSTARARLCPKLALSGLEPDVPAVLLLSVCRVLWQPVSCAIFGPAALPVLSSAVDLNIVNLPLPCSGSSSATAAMIRTALLVAVLALLRVIKTMNPSLRR